MHNIVLLLETPQTPMVLTCFNKKPRSPTKKKHNNSPKNVCFSNKKAPIIRFRKHPATTQSLPRRSFERDGRRGLAGDQKLLGQRRMEELRLSSLSWSRAVGGWGSKHISHFSRVETSGGHTDFWEANKHFTNPGLFVSLAVFFWFGLT